ncbi:hypothetical protein MSAN_02532800 [Mycena sanguinolenta]|uniref:Uncharacterized protein n=1 Tax=Mycena sanguinolenta TaxID=230812 RepID=A0A8H6WNV5_9AGAR|nr:hypothetical protein MSAN_02532800 [Mycena sanguinolenta]
MVSNAVRLLVALLATERRAPPSGSSDARPMIRDRSWSQHQQPIGPRSRTNCIWVQTDLLRLDPSHAAARGRATPLPLAHDAWLGFVCKSGPHFVDKRDAIGVVGSVKDDSRRYRSPAQHGWSTSGAKNVNVATSSNPNGPGAPSSTSCVLLWQGFTRVHPIKGCKVVHTVIAWLCKTQGASPSMPGASMLPLMVDKPSSAMIRPIPLSWSVARPARASVVVGPLASRLE